jgi:hypothetical protein
MYDTESLNSLKKNIADHMRNQNKPLPSDEELNDYALKLLDYFNLLITGTLKTPKKKL